jgi:hypothetical protein
MLQVDLKAQNRLDASLFAGCDELDRPGQQAMVGKAEGGHTVSLGGLHQVSGRQQALLQGISGVSGEVKVHRLDGILPVNSPSAKRQIDIL